MADFDVEELKKAAAEGRLWVRPARLEVSREDVKSGVRAYVRRIRHLATPRYSKSIDLLWDELLEDDDLMVLLMPKPHAHKCKEFDKYGVMRLIGVMYNHGVYKPYSHRRFSALLDPDLKDSIYRKYLGMGIEQRPLLLKVRRLIEQYEV